MYVNKPMLQHLNDSNSLDESDAVIVVFLHAGGNRQNVAVKDDVVGTEADFVDEDVIWSRADVHFALHVRRLAATYTATSISILVSL